MDIKKYDIMDLEGVYSTLEVKLSGKQYYAAASEVKGHGAFIIDSDDLKAFPLWEDEDSGVMNLIQIPNEEKILAITKFYPVFQSKEAEIVLLEPNEGYLSPWKKRTLFNLPYCHRIGAFQNDNGKYLICCALCKDKEYEQDWRYPGAVYITKIGDWKLYKIYEGLTKNHGLFIDGCDAYVTADEGVFKFSLESYKEGDEVKAEKLSSNPTSDISFYEDLVATIEPFHGNVACLYNKDFQLQKKFDIDFGHVVYLGKINGKSSLILGSRGRGKELLLIDLETSTETVIESEVGPTQISVVNKEDRSFIFSANHGKGKVTLYEIKD